MITLEQWDEYRENGIPEEVMLTDDMGLEEIWEKYVEEDDKAICGMGTHDPRVANQVNVLLAKYIGIEACLPDYGQVVDIGAGYNCIERLLAKSVDYFPCDLVKRTPTTTVINGTLPFEDNSTDCVVSNNAFQHMTPNQRERYVEEAMRILKPRGDLFIGCNTTCGLFKSARTLEFEGKHYVATGDFMTTIPDDKEVNNWIAKGFHIVTINSRTDGYTGIWLKKPDAEQMS